MVGIFTYVALLCVAVTLLLHWILQWNCSLVDLTSSIAYWIRTLSDAGDNVSVQTHHLMITCYGLESGVIRTTIYRPVIAVLCISPLLYRRLSVCLVMKVRIGLKRRKKWEALCLLGHCQSHHDHKVLLPYRESGQWKVSIYIIDQGCPVTGSTVVTLLSLIPLQVPPWQRQAVWRHQ